MPCKFGAKGETPVQAAAQLAHREIAEMLLAHGADVNVGAGGATPLHGAAMFNCADMAKWLLSHGADLALVNYEGKTPL
ncbi:MAG TPA: ankyrin repeat domain-containing protein [Chloroflexia bacterium]|nr:ankyrin repeat domain-containing protein [Chloroflexia bacterium]